MSLCILEVVHWITLSLYILVLAKALFVAPHVKTCPHKDGMEVVLYFYLIMLSTMSVVFIYLQIDWIISNYDTVVEESHAMIWAIYDIANALAHFFFLLGLEVFLKWKCLDKQGNACPRRRRDDP